MKRPLLFAIVGVALAVSAMIVNTATSEDNRRDLRLPAKVLDVATSVEGVEDTGILRYDNGLPQSRDGAIGPFPNILFIGNRVARGVPGWPLGPPPPPPSTPPPSPPGTFFSVTAVSVNLAGLYGSVFNMGFFAPAPVSMAVSPANPTVFPNTFNPTGTSAPLIAVKNVLATAPGWNVVVFATPVTTNRHFLAGVVNTNFAACLGVTTINTAPGTTCEGVALGAGTNTIPGTWPITPPNPPTNFNFPLGHNAMRIQLSNSLDPVGSLYAAIPGQNALIRLVGYVPVELMRFEVE